MLLQYLCALLPVIPGGVLNMIFVKSPWLKQLAVPLDGGRVPGEGKRWLGDNKTWKGLIGMIVLTSCCAVLLGIVPHQDGVFQSSRSWRLISAEASYGALLGLAYILAELPNSFLKRRIDIPPGQNVPGLKGALFTAIDQADSVIGGALLIACYMPLHAAAMLGMIAMASGIHYCINVLLYLARLKKQAR